MKPLQNQDLSDRLSANMAESLNDRVRQRLKDEKTARKLSERDIAGLIQWTQSKVAQKFSGRTPITLDELDALCFALSILPSEAVRDRGLEFSAEMTPTELRILEHYRHETEAMQNAIAAILKVRLKQHAPERHAAPLPAKKMTHR